MSRYVSPSIRLYVAERANQRCEYCLVYESDMWYTYWIDHIISVKHGGNSDVDNLAYTCSVCNQNKGTDLGTYLIGSNRLIRLFNPRRDKWAGHFLFENGYIVPTTKIGEATEKVLDFNSSDRVVLRKALNAIGRYP